LVVKKLTERKKSTKFTMLSQNILVSQALISLDT